MNGSDVNAKTVLFCAQANSFGAGHVDITNILTGSERFTVGEIEVFQFV